ncbi:hypothetical protein F511_31593 [Dorcoceras hygrometricum]|uniref:Uncharacterized protein n=1 Tax=Dorcoceras hygrometricum TaxID=472368 RepID=A0A2Z7D1G6_9LAMI|nr:hypothetical protein F511_31593 [Dorcoceras hygrometricum]
MSTSHSMENSTSPLLVSDEVDNTNFSVENDDACNKRKTKKSEVRPEMTEIVDSKGESRWLKCCDGGRKNHLLKCLCRWLKCLKEKGSNNHLLKSHQCFIICFLSCSRFLSFLQQYCFIALGLFVYVCFFIY